MTAVAALLLVVGVLVGAGPRARSPVSHGDGARPPGGPAGSGRAIPSGVRAGAGRRPRGVQVLRVAVTRWARSARPAGAGADDLAGTVTTVCSLLRAGARPADAWARALHLPACGTVPTLEQLLVGPPGADHARRRPARTAGELGRARAVVAAAAVAHQLGAPLATVLDEVAAAVVADAEAEAELAAALAGPRTSVRVLLGLPALGVLLGAALGAEPLTILLGGGPGTLCGLLGCALVLAGWCWTRALVRRARRAAAA